jgi:hypothetical protein
MRLRAHASTKAGRTLSRSKRRLAELALVDESALPDVEREAHRAKVHKHLQAVAECEKRSRTSIVTTNPAAALMKFPDGAGLPGHRVSTVAGGVQARVIVAVLVGAEPNDYGLLESVVGEADKTLAAIGVAPDAKLQLAADAGYASHADLAFADRERERIDVLIDGAVRPEGGRFFGRDRFVFREDGRVDCPAGRPMIGPRRHNSGQEWCGVGCEGCSLQSQCTGGKRRSLIVNVELDRLRARMSERLAPPGGKSRYNRRIATVEPVFSNIESTMGYRRASSRFEQTVLAEVLLKVLAHNISRLRTAKRLSCAYYLVMLDGSPVPLGKQFPATL